LELVIQAAAHHVAVDIAIPEVFGFDQDGMPLIRTDGLWSTIHAPRLFAWRPGGTYAIGDFGVPAVPSYVMASPWFSADNISLMHYGYADPFDQKSKYERYRGHNGHANAHVESIMAQRTLVRWDAPYVGSAWKQSTLS
jgi:hypothetical protein